MNMFIITSLLAAFFILPNSAVDFHKHDYSPQYETAYKFVDSQYKM